MQAWRELEPFFKAYIACYLTVMLVGAACLIARRKHLALFSADYRKFLLLPWRLTTFIIAFLGMVLVAPYTGDPTWDYVDAAYMSLLTYLTAPWTVSTLHFAFARRARMIDIFIALVIWLTVASWSYDLYILFKLHMYPPTWAVNIAASSVLYLCAGLMWNLDWRAGKGVVFAFREPGWPQPAGGSFMRIAGFAAPFMLIVSLGVAYFLWTQW